MAKEARAGAARGFSCLFPGEMADRSAGKDPGDI